jgi:hypothetical protein
MIAMECHCGNQYFAKAADLKRGWGLSCSKHCAAVRRDFGKPAAKRLDGQKIVKTKNKPSSDRVGAYAGKNLTDYEHRQACYDSEAGWDGHKSWF